ncbi:VOC family protein [Spirosoma gilvum]
MNRQESIQTTFDHLIFASYYLEDGVDFIFEQLGVRPQKGGQHLTMGTHNAVLKLADTTYLEVIAIDPDLPKPSRPRWFGMDNLQPGSPPQLLTWVVRTTDIQRAVRRSTWQHGRIESLQRGIYHWQIAIAEDGQLPLQGIAPTIIQWSSEAHPAQGLPASDVILTAIEILHHKAAELKDWLTEIGYDGSFTANPISTEEDCRLKVTLASANGPVTFESVV